MDELNILVPSRIPDSKCISFRQEQILQLSNLVHLFCFSSFLPYRTKYVLLHCSSSPACRHLLSYFPTLIYIPVLCKYTQNIPTHGGSDSYCRARWRRDRESKRARETGGERERESKRSSERARDGEREGGGRVTAETETDRERDRERLRERQRLSQTMRVSMSLFVLLCT